MTFQEWFLKNTQLQTYKPIEIVEVAVACGFTYEEISRYMVTVIEMTTAIENVSPLYTQWQYLKMYQNQGTQWEVI
jgi:hypothetical protein